MAAPLESSVVRIYSKSGKVVGAGFLVSSKYVLTCAHVVTDALGIARSTQEQPEGVINLDFPLLAVEQRFTAKVIFWQPVNRNQKFEDIAGLELETDLPDTAQPAQLVTSEDLWGHPFQAFGFPAGQPNGVSASGVLRGRIANGWVQVEDVKQPGYRLEPGFSGAPVWDEELQGVVGMAVAAEKERLDAKVAFMIPANVLIAAWPELDKQAIPCCPYRGLFAFREQDAQFFFGRKTFTEQLFAAVQKQQLVAVIGSSGSGKSSVVLAGLIPKLREEGSWLIESFRPNKQPFYELAAALISQLEPELGKTDKTIKAKELAESIRQHGFTADVSAILKENPGKRLLLVVDQFEELYTGCTDTEQQQFVDALLAAVESASRTITLVLTLRADFYSYLVNYPRFTEALNKYPAQNLSLMEAEEMQAAIELPAQKMGIKLQEGLTERILEDVKQEPGNLPLLEFALTQLWAKQSQGRLTHQAYSEIGGVAKALSNHAEAVYGKLSQEEQKQAQRIFLQLVRPGEGTEDTRRVAIRGEVGNWQLVTRLADARLVVTGRDEQTEEETVEVVHETLIREWERLRGWMDDNRIFRTWQERLRALMRQWEATKEDEGALLRGVPLAEAEEWLRKRLDEISPDERIFIQQSLELREKERAEKEAIELEKLQTQVDLQTAQQAKQILDAAYQKAKRRISLGSRILAVFLAIAAATGGLALKADQERREAQKGTKLEQSGVTALQQFQSGSGQITALLGAMHAGQELIDIVKDGRSLQDYPAISPLLALQTILDNIHEYNQLPVVDGKGWNVSFSPDKQYLITATDNDTIQVWNLSRQEKTQWQSHQNLIWRINFCPDGRRFFTESVSSNNDKLKVWDLSGKLLAKFSLSGSETWINISPDCQWVVKGNRDGTLQSLDLSGKQLARWNSAQGMIRKDSSSFSPDGQRLVTSGTEDSIKLWDRSGKLQAQWQAKKDVNKIVKFSPDGQRIVTTEADHTVAIWNLSGKLVALLRGHTRNVNNVSFSPDGRLIVTGGVDNTIRLWDSSGQQIVAFTGECDINVQLQHSISTQSQCRGVDAVSFSPDGQYLITRNDTTVRLRNLSGQVLTELNFPKGFTDVSYSHDGKWLATAGGVVKVWQLSGQKLVQFSLSEEVNGLSFGPNGQLLITATGGALEGKVQLWKPSGERVGEWKAHEGEIRSVSLSHDGKLIATSSPFDNTARLWNLSGEQIAEFREHQRDGVWDVSLSPDGQLLATVGGDGTVRLWDLKGHPIKQWKAVEHRAAVTSVSWSKDGEQILTTAGDGTTRLWNKQGRMLAQFPETQGKIDSASFSPDGTRIATASDKGTVRLWNLWAQQLGVFNTHLSGVLSVSFTPDGQRLLTVGVDNTVRLWNLSGQQLAQWTGYQGEVHYVSLSIDGQSLAIVGKDNTMQIWHVDEGLAQLLLRGCDWLNDYFTNHPQDLEKLKVCQKR